jgi:chromosome segregation ATPase
MEGSLSAAESERNNLAAACADANERRQSEVHALGLKLDALRSRSDAAEKLAAGVRQSLVERTEAMRTAEAKLLEVIVARGEAEKKVEHLAVVSSGWEQQTKKLELEVAALAERCKLLSETLTANGFSRTPPRTGPRRKSTSCSSMPRSSTSAASARWPRAPWRRPAPTTPGSSARCRRSARPGGSITSAASSATT